MPVLKKRGALFPVYHDSPDAKQPAPVPAPAATKKHVLSARSPTLRHSRKSSMGSRAGLKPSQSAMAASAALQSQSHTAATARKPLALVSAHSANVRSLGMGVAEPGKPGKMQVFVEEGDVNPVGDTRLRPRRALGEKPAQGTTHRHVDRPHKAAPSDKLRVYQGASPVPRGQENIPPAGEYTEDHPAPTRRTTRKSTSVFHTTVTPAGPPRTRATPSSHDSALDPDSPYLAKPRLRKLKPASGTTHPPPARGDPSSQPTTSVVIASSQPTSETQEPLHSSPPFTRPQTRKQPLTSTSTTMRTSRYPVPPYPVPPDPILSDVSEAYGADRTLQPSGFDVGAASLPRRSTRRPAVQRDPDSGLPCSTYGWIQVATGEYRAPRPPAARMNKQGKTR